MWSLLNNGASMRPHRIWTLTLNYPHASHATKQCVTSCSATRRMSTSNYANNRNDPSPLCAMLWPVTWHLTVNCNSPVLNSLYTPDPTVCMQFWNITALSPPLGYPQQCNFALQYDLKHAEHCPRRFQRIPFLPVPHKNNRIASKRSFKLQKTD